MSSYECDTCGTRYTSPSAMMWCCVSEDQHGYPTAAKGGDWIP